MEAAGRCYWPLTVRRRNPGPGPHKILGECQGAAVSSAPRVELTSAAPNASLYAPGVPVPDVLASTPARMPQAGPCQPTRSAAARVSVTSRALASRLTAHTNRPAGERTGPVPEGMSALGACRVLMAL